jgi:signal peptide peptidase SppA
MADAPAQPYEVQGGVAILNMAGPTTKGETSMQDVFGGTSTVAMRRNLRAAISDPDVKAVMLAIDSPGGTMDGTVSLADDVAAATKKKPVCAYVDGMACSAAYWIASQCTRIDMGRDSEAGSIGVFAKLADSSAAAEKAGVKVEVFKDGEYKGIGIAGTSLTDSQRAYIQEGVNEAGEMFRAAVMQGRGLTAEQTQNAAGGRKYMGKRAKALGLVDGICSFDQALARLQAYDPTNPETAPKGAKETNTMANSLWDTLRAKLGGAESEETVPAVAVVEATDVQATALLAAVTEAGITNAAQLEGFLATAKLGAEYLDIVRKAASAEYVRAVGQDKADPARLEAFETACFTDASNARDQYRDIADAKFGISADKPGTRETAPGKMPVVAVDAPVASDAEAVEAAMATTALGRKAKELASKSA